MGEYVYRVTAKTIKLDDGRIAHVAKFAYKPYSHGFFRGGGDQNAKMYFSSGCTASDRMTLKSDLIATIDPVKGVGVLYANKNGYTVFSDYQFGTEGMPKTGKVEKVGNTWKID